MDIDVPTWNRRTTAQVVKKGLLRIVSSASARKRLYGVLLTRRPAIHFGVFYSTSDQYAVIRSRVIPVDGRWMDPVALYRSKTPLDSYSMRALPEAEKQIPVSVMLENGEVVPANAKIVWPYQCSPI
jgi:hypothetical protein